MYNSPDRKILDGEGLGDYIRAHAWVQYLFFVEVRAPPLFS